MRGRLTAIPRFQAGGKGAATTLKAASTATRTQGAPFHECPAIGEDNSCGVLVDVTATGTTVLNDSSQGPYDGTDDTLVGVLNQSNKPISALSLASNADIFGFDGDGICTYSGWDGQSGCPYGPTGYEGPGTRLDGTGSNTGSVIFAKPLQPGASAYFSLEAFVSSANISNPKAYAALGDSYSSGQGSASANAKSWYSKTCLRGPGGWPMLMSDDSGGTLVLKGSGTENSFFACSGATSGQILYGSAKQPDQVQELEKYSEKNGTPGLITVTAGGDDAHFAALLTTCYTASVKDVGQCPTALTAEITYLTRWHKSFSNKLAKLYTKILAAAGGQTHLEVVGYPKIMPPWTSIISASLDCNWIDFQPSVLVLAEEMSDALNNDIRQAASQAHVGYASVADAVAGHTLCTGAPWIGELNLWNALIEETAGHPLPSGQSHLASTVLGDMRDAGLPFVRSATVQSTRRAPVAVPSAKKVPGPKKQAVAMVKQASQALAVETTAVPGEATVGDPYVGYLIVTGGTEPYSWKVTSGSLPEGLTLDPESGVISGRTTATGHSTVTVTASDSTEPSAAKASASVTITSSAPRTLSVEGGALPTATVGRPYEAKLASTGGTNPITWRLEAGSLPAGLSLNEETGVISGTPTTAGSASLTMRAFDSAEANQQSASAKIELLVDAESSAFSIAPHELGATTQGTFYDESLDAVGGSGPVEWSLSSGTLPAGVSLSENTGKISGVPTESGTFPITIGAKDRATPTPHAAEAHVTLHIAAGTNPAILTASLPVAEQGTGYYASLSATGGVGAYHWYVSEGSLPPGITLEASSGTIEGVPAESGVFSFTVTATDEAAPEPRTATATISITVAPSSPSIDFLPPEATVGSAYSYTPTVSGGVAPYSWSTSSGSLPEGLSLDPATGTISGTPTTAGSSELTVRVADSSLPASQSVTASAPLAVSAEPSLQLETSALPNAVSGEPYRALILASGGSQPLTYSVIHGALPEGLSLEPDTGVITGTPVTSGTSEFTLQVEDSSQPRQVRTATLAITVGGVPPLTITTTALGGTMAGSPYTESLIATGGTRPYAWHITHGALPEGLSLSESGQITGDPSEAGTFSFTVEATDAATTPESASVTLTLTVEPTAELSLANTSLANGEQGRYYDEPLEAAGGIEPYAWSISAGALPEGLTLDAFDGVIYGDPSAYGSFSFTVDVTDSTSPTHESATRKLSIKIAADPPLALLATSLSAGKQGEYYSQSLGASGGVAPYTATVTHGVLPEGLAINDNGEIYGEITSAQSETFTVSLHDESTPHPQIVTREYSIGVTPAPPLELSTAVEAFVQGQYGSRALGVTGGVPGFSWKVGASKLPAGLAFSNGSIYGTATKTGKGTLTVTVTDSATPTAHNITKTISVTVAKPAKLKITTKKLPSATRGDYYQQQIATSGGTPPDSTAISSGVLPPGMSVSGEWIYGTPETAGTYSFTVKITDSGSPKPQTATKTFSLKVT